ncbi:MAG: STT3 domain-containing protein [Candidatus Micrarchaeia archaeon]
MDLSKAKKLLDFDDKKVLYFWVAVILLIGIFERAGMLKYQGLYEPDGFYYYSIIMQTIANHYIRPALSIYSGFPWHNPIAESPGLEYITVIPYMLLHYFGVSALQIMRAMPIFFALLEIITIYYLTKFIVNSRIAGLLAMFFLAVSSGNIARTAALVYRGDSFISLFLMLSLLFMLLALEHMDALHGEKNELRRHMLREHVGSDIVYRHMSEEKELKRRQLSELSLLKGHSSDELEKLKALHKSELERLVEEHLREEELIYRSSGRSFDASRHGEGIAKPIAYLALSAFLLSMGVVIWTGSPYIVVVYMFAILLLLIYAFIAGNESLLFSDIMLSIALLSAYALEKLFIAVHFAPAGITLTGDKFFVFYMPLLIGTIAGWYIVKSNWKAARDPVGRFSILGIVAVIVLVLAFTIFLPYINAMTSTVGIDIIPPPPTITNTITYAVGQTTQELQKPSWAFLFGSFHVQLVLAPLGIILFLLLGDRIGKTTRHRLGVSINFNEGMLVMLAYLLVTAFLQYAAIRYNSLFSIPIAIFAAYGTYAIWALLKEKRLTQRAIIAFIAIVFDVLIAYELIKKVFPLFSTGLAMLFVSALIVNIMLIYVFVYSIYATSKRNMNLQHVFIGLMVALLVMNFYSTYVQSISVTQADGINPLFLQAMAWMRNNTPSNATVLTMWPDGSVVEAWAQRQSYTDSVGGENASRIYPFAHFLFGTNQSSLAYIEKVHPDYIVARTFWFDELGGVAVEGLVSNASAYGYDILESMNITQENITRNETAGVYTFTSPNYTAKMIVARFKNNGTTSLYAYIGSAQSKVLYPIERVLFYNTSSYMYSIVNTTTRPAINETLMISYGNRGITGAVILGPKLLSSNIFKLVYLCNYYGCPYNGTIRMRDIYMNNDTRIIKVYYNLTSSHK